MAEPPMERSVSAYAVSGASDTASKRPAAGNTDRTWRVRERSVMGSSLQICPAREDPRHDHDEAGRCGVRNSPGRSRDVRVQAGAGARTSHNSDVRALVEPAYYRPGPSSRAWSPTSHGRDCHQLT